MSQMLFDKIVLNLLAQGKPAIDEQGVYKYRCQVKRTVLKSPIGFLIPDIVYNTEMEKQNVINVIRNTPELRVYINYEELIYALEAVASKSNYQHKNCCYFVEDLIQLANRFNLNTTALSNFKHVSNWTTARMRAKSLLKEYNI